MNREECIANFASGVSFCEKITNCKKIPFGFRHFLAVDEQVCAVEPETDERFACGCFALGNFIFMMRENEIFASTMNIQCFAQMFHAHARTLDMPTGAALSPWAFPKNLSIAFRVR